MKKPSRLAQRRLPPKKKRNYRFLILLPVILIVVLGFWFLATPSKWGGGGRLGVAFYKQSGDVVLTNFDSEAGTITTILIPKSTQVQAAKNLGTWPLASIPKLGENEKAGGDFVATTITKSFKFPTEAWAEDGGTKTNLSLKDRLRLKLFSLGVKDSHHVEINLADTKYVRKTRLADGTEGYVIQGEIPLNLMSIFSDSTISESKLNILITNATGEGRVASDVSKIVEVMGGKVTSIQKTTVDEKLDCQIITQDFTEVAEKFAKVFNCPVVSVDPSGNFNLEIKLGKIFKTRF